MAGFPVQGKQARIFYFVIAVHLLHQQFTIAEEFEVLAAERQCMFQGTKAVMPFRR